MRPARGFTLLELMTVVAIAGILAAIAIPNISRQRPRANLANTAAELQAIIHGARQSALASGNDVAIMFFPDYVTGNSIGRVIIYRDGDFDLFTTSRYVSYNPAVLAHGPNSEVLEVIDLPRGITAGPANGMGTGAVLPAPLAAIPVSVYCSFCGGTAPNRRAAIRFDTHGRAWFYNNSNPSNPLPNLGGASLTIQAAEIDGRATLVITSAAGSVQLIKTG